MHPLLLHGFGTSVRVNGRTLEIDSRSEGKKEAYRPQQLPFDSVVVDSLTGSVSFEALRFLAIHDVPVTLLRWNGTVLSTILPRGPTNGELRVAQVEAYGDAELRLMVRLVTSLKAAFDEAGVPLSQFYGAGAAATAFLTKIEARKYIDHMEPVEVETAGRHAYFGGRVEVPFYGNVPGPIYRYDLNSAYPSALAELPNIAAGKWIRGKSYRPDLRFSVYHVRWKFPRGRPFYPFPWRSPEGAIYFPPTGRAWLWHPEVTAALECGGFPNGAIRIDDAWHFIPDDPTERPFEIVREKYDIRQKLKAEGKPAQKALKLLLASLTGKLAQSVSAAGKFGAEQAHARKPTYHQIEYAGYINSVCRARVYRAACQKPDAILAIATDGILTREPLNVPISNRLGEWSVETFQAATIVQSGVYRLQKSDGKWLTYGRGYADKQLPWPRIDRAWRNGKRKLTVRSRKRFIGVGAALQSADWSRWRRFVPIPREVELSAVGKRIDLHLPRTWTPEDNPATRPHETEPYDPVIMEGYDPESTPWRPKWEDPGAGTVEDWELTAERTSSGGCHASDLSPPRFPRNRPRTRMAPLSLHHSLAEVDRAGVVLRDSTGPLPTDVVNILYNWRFSHTYPIHVILLTLEKRAAEVDPTYIVASRVKRQESIAAKLSALRSRGLALSKVQDIGGCRVITRDVDSVRRIRDAYEGSRIRHKLWKVNDYIHSPKKDGYRSLHMVYEYRGRGTVSFNGMRIEIQLRTKLQHSWATAIETLETFFKRRMRALTGHPEWGRFMALVSSAIALEEGCPPVPDTPATIEELKGEIRHLNSSLGVRTTFEGLVGLVRVTADPGQRPAAFYLLELHPASNQMSATPFYNQADLPNATERLKQVEQQLRQTAQSDPGANAVLVTVRDVKQLPAAYPNYYLDAGAFVEVLDRLLKAG